MDARFAIAVCAVVCAFVSGSFLVRAYVARRARLRAFREAGERELDANALSVRDSGAFGGQSVHNELGVQGGPGALRGVLGEGTERAKWCAARGIYEREIDNLHGASEQDDFSGGRKRSCKKQQI